MKNFPAERNEFTPELMQDETAFYDLYNQTFQVLRADTPSLMREVYKLRYQIYCIENPFEDPNNNLNQLEMDAYDSHAVHYLLIHRRTKLPVGTVRMVLPVEENLYHSLPIQSVCDIEKLRDPEHIRRTGEISRFCISQTMRQRLTDDLVYSGVQEPDTNAKKNAQAASRRMIYHAALGLIRACIEVMQERGIASSYLICEPTLLRILGKLGVCSTPIGPLVEYHGLRQPVLVSDSEVLENTLMHHPEIWTVLSDNGRLHSSSSRKSRKK